MVILLCGRGEYSDLLKSESVNIVHARTRAALDASLLQGPIDVAIIEETPWPGEDAISLCRSVRGRGIGTVFAARGADSAARLLRERMTVDLSGSDLEQHLDNAVWLACSETELMRRDAAELFARIASGFPPLFMRYVEEDGQLAPSQSTMAYIFDEPPKASVIEGKAPLVAPQIPGAQAWQIEESATSARSTIALEPSASFLRSLRREHARVGAPRHFWIGLAVIVGAIASLLTLGVLFWP
jgi:hypothetical protein